MAHLICRLCELPVLDGGGLLLQDLDEAKLSEWWTLILDTDFQASEEDEESCFCWECVWDARYLHENSEAKSDEGVWWPSGFNESYTNYIEEATKFYLKEPDEVQQESEVSATDIEESKGKAGVSIGTEPEVTPTLENELASSYVCNICAKSFKRLSVLTAHAKSHSQNFGSSSESELELQENSENSKTKIPVFQISGGNEQLKFKCLICFKFYKSAEAYRDHSRKIHPGSKRTVCPHCRASSFLLKPQTLACQFCKKIIPCNAGVRVKRVNTGEPNNCSICSKSFCNFYKLQYHKNSQHKPADKWRGLQHKKLRLKCDEHKIYFKSATNLRLHKLNLHQTGGRQRIECDICKQDFASAASLQVHRCGVHGLAPKNLECNNCGERFYLKRSLILHICNEHLKEKGQVQCKICLKNFKSVESIRTHNINFH